MKMEITKIIEELEKYKENKLKSDIYRNVNIGKLGKNDIIIDVNRVDLSEFTFFIKTENFINIIKINDLTFIFDNLKFESERERINLFFNNNQIGIIE
jgi:hypothetical protein